MTILTAEPKTSVTSPFDQIKRTRDDGTEYWSARNIQLLMGYERWEDFAKVTRRAMASAANTGHAEGFSVISEKLPSGGRPREDFHLSRYAAYLVAMNGDPNMRQVAAAQSYFAVRTRQAEVQPVKQLSGPELIAAAMAELNKQVEAQRSHIAELEPKAEGYDNFLKADGVYSMGVAAKILGLSRKKLFELVRNHGVLIAKGAMKNSPYQQYMHHFVVKACSYERSDGNWGSSYTTYVQVSGLYFLRKKLGLDISKEELDKRIKESEVAA